MICLGLVGGGGGGGCSFLHAWERLMGRTGVYPHIIRLVSIPTRTRRDAGLSTRLEITGVAQLGASAAFVDYKLG